MHERFMRFAKLHCVRVLSTKKGRGQQYMISIFGGQSYLINIKMKMTIYVAIPTYLPATMLS